MNNKKYSNLVRICAGLAMLSMVLALPAPAFADPGDTPQPTAEVVGQQDSSTSTEEAAAPTDEATVEAAATEVADTDGAPLESAATDEPAVDEATDSAVEATPEATSVSGAEATAENNDTAAEEPAVSEETLAEAVEALDEAGAELVDSNGEVLSLASEAAAEALTAPDPIGCPAGVMPVSWGGTGTGCTASYASIQAAIDDVAVVAGWTIYIDPGTFTENVQVTKSVTLQGSGQGITIIQPAAIDANTCPGSCPSATNTVVWVLADHVSIFDLTVDGDNPGLTSAYNLGGANVDAHNGIVTNTNTDLKFRMSP